MRTWMQKEPVDERNLIANRYKHALGLKAAEVDEVPDVGIVVSTMKYDGELNLAFLDDGVVTFANRYSRLRVEMEAGEELAEAFKEYGNCTIAGELYAVGENESKLTLGEVMHRIKNPHNDEEEASIRFAAFDILRLNGEEWHEDYLETVNLLDLTLDGYTKVHSADWALGESGLTDMWAKVIENKMEGLVVRTGKGVFKVKQKFDLDLAVIGLTMTGKSWGRGEASALVLAFLDDDGHYRYAGTVGGGLRPGEIKEGDLPQNFRKWWFQEGERTSLGETKLGNKPVRLIKPQHVITVRADEWVIDDRLSLEYDGKTFNQNGALPAAVGQKPRVVKYREDKSRYPLEQGDIRLEQIPEMTE